MKSLAIATIRHRKSGFVGMFVAVLCAATLLTALGVLLESGLRSGVAPQRYAGAAVVVGAQQALPVVEDIDVPFSERVPLPAETVGRIADVVGVDRAIGDRSVLVTLLAGGQPVPGVADRPVEGYGWSAAALAPFTLREGDAPRPGGVVLDAGLASRAGVAVGDTVDLAIGAIPTAYTVTGITEQSFGRQSALFLTDDEAAELSGRPAQVDAVGVLAEPGVDADELAERIQAALPGLNVATYTGDRRGDVEFLDVGQVRAELVVLALTFIGTALMITMLVVASTLGLSIQQRRRELALLRAVAATPRQIHRMIGAEIRLVAGAAAVLGAIPGIGVAYLLRTAFAAGGVIPADFGLALSPVPPVVAVLLCLGTARLAGYLAARRAARINPIEALQESAVEPRGLPKVRLIIGWAAAVLGLGASTVPIFVPGEAAVAGAAGSAFLVALAVALLGPRLVAGMVRWVAAPLRRLSPVGGYLASANVAANSRRLAGVVTPMVLAVAMASVQIFSQTTVAAAAVEQADDGMRADFVVSAPSGLDPSITAEVAAADGVALAAPIVRSQAFVRYLEAGSPQVGSYAAQGVVPAGLERVLDLEPRSGTLADLRGDTVAVSELAAETIGVEVGETIDLHLGDGTALRPTVVATYGRGLGFGDITLPRDLLAEHTTTRLDQSILVAADDHAAAQRSLAELAYPGLAVLDRDGLAAAGQSQRQADAWLNLVGLVVILGYLAIAVVNTLVMATAARSREFAMLRLVGTGHRQVTRMMRIEALLVVGMAAVVGTLAAIPALIGVSIGLTESPLPSVPPLVYVGIVGTTSLLGLLAIGIPTRLALRARPVTVVSGA